MSLNGLVHWKVELESLVSDHFNTFWIKGLALTIFMIIKSSYFSLHILKTFNVTDDFSNPEYLSISFIFVLEIIFVLWTLNCFTRLINFSSLWVFGKLFHDDTNVCHNFLFGTNDIFVFFDDGSGILGALSACSFNSSVLTFSLLIRELTKCFLISFWRHWNHLFSTMDKK